MMDALYLATVLSLFGISAFQDWRTESVNILLPISASAVGLVYYTFYSPFIALYPFLVGIVLAFTGFVIHRRGYWRDGDTAVLAAVGFTLPFSVLEFLLLFMVSLPVYGRLYKKRTGKESGPLIPLMSLCYLIALLV